MENKSFVPTTFYVRDSYADDDNFDWDARLQEFDAWFKQELAKAWEQGYDEATDNATDPYIGQDIAVQKQNPYV